MAKKPQNRKKAATGKVVVRTFYHDDRKKTTPYKAGATNPVSGVKVSVGSQDYKTDRKGEYTRQNVPAGLHPLKVSDHPMFGKPKVGYVQVGGGAPRKVDPYDPNLQVEVKNAATTYVDLICEVPQPATPIFYTADPAGCNGALRVIFPSRGVAPGRIVVNVLGPGSFVGSRELAANEHDLLFTGLSTGLYKIFVSVPWDLTLAGKAEISVHGKAPFSQNVAGGNSVEADVLAPFETRVKLDFQHKPLTVQVIAFVDRAKNGDPDGQPPIENIGVTAIFRENPIGCQNTDSNGCTTYSLDQPGVYVMQAPPVVTVGGCTYRLVPEGPITFVVGPGTCPIRIPFPYTRTGGSIFVSPKVPGGHPLPPDPVEFHLHDAFDPTFLRTGASVKGSPVSWQDLPAKVYDVRVKAPDGFEVEHPPLGLMRVLMPLEQTIDLTGLIRLKARKETETAVKIAGQITDDSGPLANQVIDLVAIADHRVVQSSFTSERGEYSFRTVQDVTKLAIRVQGQTVPVVEKGSDLARIKDTAIVRDDIGSGVLLVSGT